MEKLTTGSLPAGDMLFRRTAAAEGITPEQLSGELLAQALEHHRAGHNPVIAIRLMMEQFANATGLGIDFESLDRMEKYCDELVPAPTPNYAPRSI